MTISIARSGIEIVGLDNSESMLNAARRKARSNNVAVNFVQCDMRNFNVPGLFSAVLIPGNSLLHLHTNLELKQCLNSVRRHLAPGGHLIFDISKWDLKLLTRDPAERELVYLVNDPDRSEVRVEETASYDAVRQIRSITLYIGQRIVRYSLRVIFPQELPLLLELAGFQLEARYGEFPRQLFGQASPRQVCICSAIQAYSSACFF